MDYLPKEIEEIIVEYSHHKGESYTRNYIYSSIYIPRNWLTLKLVCKRWLEICIKTQSPNIFNNEPIYYYGHNLDCIKSFIKHPKTDFSLNYYKVLRYLVKRNQLEIVKLLLFDSRINPIILNNSCLRYAIKAHNAKMITLLFSHKKIKEHYLKSTLRLPEWYLKIIR